MTTTTLILAASIAVSVTESNTSKLATDELCLIPQPREIALGEGYCAAEVKPTYITDAAIPSEGYRLEIGANSIKIASSDDAGAFYAGVTLNQIKSKDGYRRCTITDAPQFHYRGVLIDDCRHFIGKENVLKTIEAMSDYKMNVLHWHLIDDPGWRLEVPKYPNLVKYGSTRKASPKFGAKGGHDKDGIYQIEINTEHDGPHYYTADDVREVLAFAAKRHVKIIPEVELPGHAMAALASYPEFACEPEHFKDRQPACKWGVKRDLYCIGNPATIKFLEDVLEYVCELFPSDTIHIGGDECPRFCWRKCPKCLEFVKREGLESADDIQGWVTQHFVDFLAKRGRRAIGWDEILGCKGVPKSAIGMSWRCKPSNIGGGVKLADFVSGAGGAMRGHDMIMADRRYCYFDYGPNIEGDPFPYMGGGLTFEKVYKFDPYDGVPDEAKSHILGGQCCMWSEFIWHYFDFQWKLWPRAFAISEILWTYPQPDKRDFASLKRRAMVHRERLVKRGHTCAPVK